MTLEELLGRVPPSRVDKVWQQLRPIDGLRAVFAFTGVACLHRLRKHRHRHRVLAVQELHTDIVEGGWGLETV